MQTVKVSNQIAGMLCVLALNFLCLNTTLAEGTAQLAPSNTDTISIFINSNNYYNFARYGSSDSERLYIHIANPESEQVFLGFSQPIEDGHYPGQNLVNGYFRILSPDGTVVYGPQLLDATTSNISSYAQCVAGPNPIAGAGGYTPFVFDPSGLDAGDYYIEFSLDAFTDSADEFAITYFDITVATTNVTPAALNGRVHAKNWAFFLPSIDKPSATYSWFDRPFNGKLYAYTTDGFVTDIDFAGSGFQPAAFNISLNSQGTGTSGSVIEDRKSLDSGQGNTVEYKIFLNNPDETVYPSGTFGSLLTDSTQLIGCPDIGYRFKVMTTQQGVIELLLDQDQASGVGVYDPGTADLILAIDINRQLTDDQPNLYTRYIEWDGLDGLGNAIDPTSVSIPVEVTFSQGRYHIPVYDVEYNLNGFTSTIIRPTPVVSYTLNYYWDDSNIPDNSNIAGQNQINSEGCLPPCHQWNNSNYGNLNTLNTYWFAKQEFQTGNLNLINDCGDDTDGDGVYDAVDIDWDNDGIPNYLENCLSANPDCSGVDPTIDSDFDGILNYEDEDFCTLNSFGICTALDPDNDGIPSFLDLDSDNDGIPDIIEAGGSDANGDGIADSLTDADNDGLANDYDSVDDSGSGVSNNVSHADDCQTSTAPTHNLSFTSVTTDALSDITFTFSLTGDYGSNFETFSITGEGGTIIASGQNRSLSDNITYGDCASPGAGYSITISQNQWNSWNDDGTVTITLQADGNVGAGVCVNSSCVLNPQVTYDIPPAGPGTDIPNADTDNDGISDFLDLDSDDDGIADLVEVGGVDTDGNGMADDMIDPATGDTNDDGWSDAITASRLVDVNLSDTDIDFDGDAYPNHLDLDSDNDGIVDVIESGGQDGDGDGQADDGAGTVTDGNYDGWEDNYDEGTIISTADGIDANSMADFGIGRGKPDFDGDGLPNWLDIDADDDGIVDNSEGQATDAYASPTVDSDGDGLDDAYENIGTVGSFGGAGIIPENTDGVADGADYLDLDADNDGEEDSIEGHDTDGDGVGDNSSNSNLGQYQGTDTDQDGLDDGYDNNTASLDPTNTNLTPSSYVDFDNTGTAERDWRETLDIDLDDDGISNVNEDGGTGFNPVGDEDGDGILNFRDDSEVAVGFPGFTDSNGDGINDVYDSDLDGIPDHVDLDSDNDGIPDIIEAGGTDIDDDGKADNYTDANNNGLDDVYDPDCAGTGNITNVETGASASEGVATVNNPSRAVDTDNSNYAQIRGLGARLDIDMGTTLTNGTELSLRLSHNHASSGSSEITITQSEFDASYTNAEVLTINANNSTTETLTYTLSGNARYLRIERTGGSRRARVYFISYSACAVTGIAIPNPDTDSDGQLDYVDLDSDNDGIADLVEVGGVDTDGNGMADDMLSPSTGDANVDGWSDAITASPLVDNNLDDNAIDFDGDTNPNHLDIDSDNDGITDVIESGGQDGNGDGQADDGSVAGTRTDANEDGWEDNYDAGVLTSTTDGTDVNTIADFSTGANQPDFDGDGLPNWLDIDADDDGIVDNSEGQATSAYTAPTTDSDNDGLNDAYENGGTIGAFGGAGISPENTDGTSDGADYVDTDSDNDLETDSIEGHDTDGDGIGDNSSNSNTGQYLGTDSDQDGLDDGYDNNTASFDPTNTNLTPSSYVDFDDTGTTERDWRETSDIDLDNDGIPNAEEDGRTGFNPVGDADGDSVPNFQDDNDITPGFPAFTDTNGDGINDLYDTDLDGIPDYLDLDADNDGIPDIVEAGGIDTNGDGRADDTTDTDGDGLVDDYDSQCLIAACSPATTGTDIPNLDTDNDGRKDYIDIDADDDGIPDIIEAGGADINNDGKVDISLDQDGDGLADIYDENASDGSGSSGTNGTALVETDNTGRWLNGTDGDLLDSDGDGQVDGLDLDADNDGIPDIVEAGGIDINGDGRVDNLTDTDADGLVDDYDSNCVLGACTPSTIGTDIPNADTDADGIVNYLDLDADNDGIPDIIEAGGIDTNGDGRVDADLDVDNDGLADIYDENASDGPGSTGTNGTALVETNGTGIWQDGNSGASLDFDGDGHHDGLDLDADNDGIPDIIEAGGADDDGDGIVDTQALPWDADNDGLADIYDENASDGPGGTGANGIALVKTSADDGNGRVDNTEKMISGSTNVVHSDTDANPNHLDLDADNDGIVDIIEAGGVDINGDGLVDDYNPANPTVFDTGDQDGWSPTYDGDAANDGALTSSGDGTPMIDTEDSNFDGFPELYTLGDTDEDVHPDFLDIDADDDGIVDNVEAQNTPGYILPSNTDTDGDGLDDAYDNDPGFGGTGIDENTMDSESTLYDHDNDGIPDYLDWDSDGDNIADEQEAWDDLLDGDSRVDASIGTCDGSDLDKDGLKDCFDDDTNSPLVTSYKTPINDNGIEGLGTTGSTPTSGNDPSEIFPNNDNGDGQPDFRDVLIDCATPQVYYAISEQSAGTTTDYEFNGTTHVDMSDTKIIRATTYCTPGDGWYYFFNPLEPENYLFALRNAAGSPNTVPMNELIDYVELKVENDRTNRHVIGASDANFVLERDWQVALKSTPTTGSTFDVKFYFQASEMNELGAAADALEATLTGPVTRDFYWFSKNGGLSIGDITSSGVTGSTDISYNDPDGIDDTNTGNTDGTAASVGNGKNYVTFLGLTSLDGGTAGILLSYAPLPVDLIRFEAREQDCDVLLNWASAQEENFSHYSLERSHDGIHFELIADITGRGGDELTNYSFTDKEAALANYYRLKMLNLDGSFEYSNVEIVELDCQVSKISVYPNPVKEQQFATITFKNINGMVSASVFDVSGKRLKVLSHLANNDQTIMDVSDLPQGTYSIQFHYKGKIESVKFIKM